MTLHHSVPPAKLMKRSRSKRRRWEVPPCIDEYLASCFLNLRRSTTGPDSVSPISSSPNPSHHNNTQQAVTPTATLVPSTSTSPTGTLDPESPKIKEESTPSPTTTFKQQRDKHECCICGMVFQSHQALGGHKASHSSKQNPKNLIDTPVLPVSSQMAAGNVVSSINHPSGTGRVHECSICGLIYPSGQALGGHMRRHYPLGGGKKEISQNICAGSSTETTVSDPRAVSTIDSRVPEAKTLPIDLNMLPPSDSDDELDLELRL